MTPTVTISRELAERLIAASKVCTGQDCPPFHHDLALAGDELRAALDAKPCAAEPTAPIPRWLAEEIIREHADPEHGDYNGCDKDPCFRCETLIAALDAPPSWDDEAPSYLIPMPPVAISATGTSGDDVGTTDAITDSDRIDWMESGKPWPVYNDGWHTQHGEHDSLRAAIDAAIKQEKK